MKIAVIMDPITSIKPSHDTSFGIMLAAQQKQFQINYIEPQDLFIRDGKAFAHAHKIKVFDRDNDWFEITNSKDCELSNFDLIFMRQDPPFDINYITNTYILDFAVAQGVRVVNTPSSVRDSNEKVFAQSFPQCCPPTLVSQQAKNIKQFWHEHGDIILKPLDGMGGQGVFKVGASDSNFSVIVETLTHTGETKIMAQKYVPEVTQGDKRIIVLNGEAVSYAVNRIPQKGEARANMAAGGRAEITELTEHDHWIVEQVSPTLKAKGLILVGLDVIGKYLTEINVTSPTCMRELEQKVGIEIYDPLFE